MNSSWSTRARDGIRRPEYHHGGVFALRKEPEGVDRLASKCPKPGAVDDSKTIRPSPRAALIVALADAVREVALGGDTGLVKVATETLTRLVKDGDGDAGQVVDLKKERDERTGK